MKTGILMAVMGMWGWAHAETVALVDVTYTMGNGGEVREQHFADLDSLAKVKGWKPGEGVSVPVTRDKALELAKDAARADGRTEFKDEDIRIEFREAQLYDADTGEPIRVPRGVSLWYYRISFDGTGGPGGNYVVAMDGKVAVRVVTR